MKERASNMLNYRLMIQGFFLFILSPVVAAAAPNPIVILEPGTNLFADTAKVDHIVSLRVPADFKGRLTWAFAASNGRVFPRGRGEVAVTGKAAPVRVSFMLDTPEVKPNAILEAQLELSLFGKAAEKPEATLTRKLYLFPVNPFVDRVEWLKELRLVVFDSDPRSRTVAALESLRIPHEWVKEVDRLTDRKEGIILVGEGVSFKEERGLSEALVQLAHRGRKVLCLAAVEGGFSVPGIGTNENAPRGLRFQRNAVIRRFDKRLDPDYWSSKGPLVSHSVHFVPEDGAVIANVKADAVGWPWIEIESANGGTLIFCQFSLMRHWDSSPTPRYLLSHILDSLSPVKENTKDR
jgi:hypothetical protein